MPLKPKPSVAEIIERNPEVKPQVLAESMRLVSLLRSQGVSRPTYNVLSPYEQQRKEEWEQS